MSVDTSTILPTVISFVQSALNNVPLGIIIIGVPAALTIAFLLTSKLVRMIGAQLGSSGIAVFGLGGSKATGRGSDLKLVSRGKARVGRPDPLAGGSDDFVGYSVLRKANAHKEQSLDSFLAEDRKLTQQQAGLDRALDKAIKRNNAADQDVETFKVAADRLAAAKRKNKPSGYYE